MPREDLAKAQPCRPSIDSCAWPRRCALRDTGEFLCGHERSTGQSCRAGSFDCATASYCEAGPWDESGTCRAQQPTGGVCTHDWECLGFCAPEGTCEDEAREDDQACDKAADCASGACHAGICSPKQECPT
jgi:hypothetical protein